MEKERLDYLPTNIKMLKMDSDFDLFEERECFSCFYDLHLSAVGCKCSPDSYSCLRHSNLFCSCDMNKKFVLLRYTMNELSTLAEALEGKPHAIEAWENRNIGLVFANAEDPCMYKQDTERAMRRTKNYEGGKGSTSCAGIKEKSNSNVPSSPHSHVSSELVHSESHHENFSTPYGALNCQNDNVNDKMSVMNNAVKEYQGGSAHFNIDVTSDEPENYLLKVADSHHNKGVPYVEKVCHAVARKERNSMELGAGGISVSEREFSSCSTSVRNCCTVDGCKLFGVDLHMHSDSGEKLNSAFEMGVLDTSNTSISLINQSLLTQKFGISVEPVSLGSVLYGKLWCSKHAIYPKGMLL